MDLIGSHAFRHAGELIQVTDEGVVQTGDVAEQVCVTRLVKDSFREFFGGKARLGAPLPALLDHAPEGYVRALKKCLEVRASASGE